MVFIVVLTLSVALGLSGCAMGKRVPTRADDSGQGLGALCSPSKVQEVQKNLDGLLAQKGIFGYVKPYVPVLEPAVVKRVWIPDRSLKEEPDVLVSGHWTYVMVRAPRWFIDSSVDEDGKDVIVPIVTDKSLEKGQQP